MSDIALSVTEKAIGEDALVNAGFGRYTAKRIMRQPYRKIIQITTSGYDLYALCDDGSLYQRIPNSDGPWTLLPEIPQPK